MGTTSTNYCITHTDGYNQITCSTYRARRTNVSTTSSAVSIGSLILKSHWQELSADIETERASRGLSTTTISLGTNITDNSTVEYVRDRLESVWGSVNSTRPGGQTTTSMQINRTKTDGGTLTAGTTTTGMWSNASGWTSASNPSGGANINNTDYNNLIIYAATINDLRDKLIQKMKDCVCHADCGSHTNCTCYSSHCNSYYY